MSAIIFCQGQIEGYRVSMAMFAEFAETIVSISMMKRPTDDPACCPLARLYSSPGTPNDGAECGLQVRWI